MWRLYLTLTSSLHLYVQKMGMTKIGKAKKTSISKHYMHHICTLIVHVHTNIIIAISTLLRSNSTLFRNKKKGWTSYLFFPKTCPTFGIILGYTIFWLGTSWRHWSSWRARGRIYDLTFSCRGRIWGRWKSCFGGRTGFQFGFWRTQ